MTPTRLWASIHADGWETWIAEQDDGRFAAWACLTDGNASNAYVEDTFDHAAAAALFQLARLGGQSVAAAGVRWVERDAPATAAVHPADNPVEHISRGAPMAKKAVKKKTVAKKTAKKKMARKRGAAKREFISPRGDARYIRRDEKGRIRESDDVGRSQNADRRTKAKRKVTSGQGDKGDQ